MIGVPHGTYFLWCSCRLYCFVWLQHGLALGSLFLGAVFPGIIRSWYEHPSIAIYFAGRGSYLCCYKGIYIVVFVVGKYFQKLNLSLR